MDYSNKKIISLELNGKSFKEEYINKNWVKGFL